MQALKREPGLAEGKLPCSNKCEKAEVSGLSLHYVVFGFFATGKRDY